MNGNPPADLPPHNTPALTCADRVYRAAEDPSWFSEDRQRIDALAFYRRRGEADSGGISIGANPHSYRLFLTKPVAGIISVHVGHVRDVIDPELRQPLDVQFDHYPHGNILHVPPKEKKGPRRRFADRIASLLARTAARPHEIFDPPRL